MKLRKLISPTLALLLAIGIILLTVAPVLAYIYGGYHWDADYAPFKVSALPTRWQAHVWEAGTTWNRAPADFDFAKSSYTDNTWTTYNYGYPIKIAYTYPYNYVGTDHLALVYTKFNTYYEFSIGGGGGTYDVQTVALHEFGHWLMLLDISGLFNLSKVMYYGYTGVKRSLHQDDINGIVFIYGS